MNRTHSRILTIATLAIAVMLLSAGGAIAAPPANTGFDGTIQVIRGVGSDTTYLTMQRIENLYNQGPGCTLLAQEAGGDGQDYYNACDPAGAEVVGANYDHDVAVSDFPAGSSAGVRMLASATPGHAVGYARSSRDKQGSDATGLSFNGYAKDGIAVVTLKGRTTASFTKNQLIGIFNTCTITTWGQIYGNSDTTPIRPYGVQSSSGTYLTFRNYINGLDPNVCANAIGSDHVKFENDMSPIDVATDAANAVTWMSFGPYSTNLAKRASAAAWLVEGTSLSFSSIFDNSYPITRYLWHVIRTAWETSTSGDTGASRAFKEWICKLQANHITNPNTDRNFFVDISGALTATGFQRVPTAESDAGTRCVRQTT